MFRSNHCDNTTSEEVCRIDKNKQTCTFNHVTIITLQPLQQQTCLTLHSPQILPMGMLTIKPEGIKFRCNRKNEFYTRDHEIVSESVHRCHRAGSCHADRCHEVKETDKLKEFSDIANNSPGYTSCSSSCGVLTCDDVSFLHSAASSTDCMLFQQHRQSILSSGAQVNAEVSLQGEDEIISTTVRLLPGRTSTWNNIHFSLIGTIVPQLPILSSTFITDGELQSHSAGQLQCSSHQAAEQFDCYFPRHACTCTTALHSATCTCSNGNIRDRMAPQPLPQASKNFIIFQFQRRCLLKSKRRSTIQLRIVAEDLQLTALKRSIRLLQLHYRSLANTILHERQRRSSSPYRMRQALPRNQMHRVRLSQHNLLHVRHSISHHQLHRRLPRRDRELHDQRIAGFRQRKDHLFRCQHHERGVESDLSSNMKFLDTIVTAAEGVASFFSVWESFVWPLSSVSGKSFLFFSLSL
ncbi:hypothetical protein COOONC_11709 [Cooperia oncophora]